MKLTYLLFVFITTCMLGCKRDNITLSPPGVGVHPSGGFGAFLFFNFVNDNDDYSVAVDASKSSPNLHFNDVRIVYDASGLARHTKHSLNNKATVELKKDFDDNGKEYRYVFIEIDTKLIKINKEYSFRIKVYKNSALIDNKIVTFNTGIGPYGDKKIMDAGYLKKLCISDWRNFERVDKYGFRLRFKYPGRYNEPKHLKNFKKTYDDCYVEGSDADKY